MPGDRFAPKRGEVWFADLGKLDPTKDAEIQKSRPVLIIGNNTVNKHRKTVVIIPLATSRNNPQPSPPLTVSVTCGGKHGIAVIDQLRAVDKHRLINLVDTIEQDDFELVIDALRQVLEIS